MHTNELLHLGNTPFLKGIVVVLLKLFLFIYLF